MEEKGGNSEEDRLIERAKDPPYDFALVPECHPELRDSVVIRVTSRRMCTFSIAEMFHLCNEAARRRAVPGLSKRTERLQTAAISAAPTTELHIELDGLPSREPKAFAAGEVIDCP